MMYVPFPLAKRNPAPDINCFLVHVIRSCTNHVLRDQICKCMRTQDIAVKDIRILSLISSC